MKFAAIIEYLQDKAKIAEVRPVHRQYLATLKANGLIEIEHIADVTSRLVVNRAALKTRPVELGDWLERFREAVDAAA